MRRIGYASPMTAETNISAFEASLGEAAPPPGLPPSLEALWWDAKGDWAKAHHCAQSDESAAGAWVHAYLHRKEGDLSNAGYWYRRAAKPVAEGPLAAEWRAILRALGAASRE
jgi:hypothetical protein